jgi:hypothetical protein
MVRLATGRAKLSAYFENAAIMHRGLRDRFTKRPTEATTMGLNTLLIIATCVYGGVLVAVIRALRPGRQQTVAALAGGVAASLLAIAIEGIAHSQGFWHYRENDTPVGPLLNHPLNVIIFAIIALIGWRIGRSFGIRGQVIWVSTITIISPPGDYFAAVHWLGIIKIDRNFFPGLLVMDIAAWGILSTVALAVMQRVYGRPNDPSSPI